MTSGVVRDHSMIAIAANMQQMESSYEMVTTEVRPNNDDYLHEKKYKHKRFKRIRSLLLHRGRVSGPRSEEASMAGHTAVTMNDKAPPVEGLCGITNHGNTCYMNAVLQCLTNTDQLAQRLVLDNFSAGARPANCLRGDITEQIALLMGLLWSNMDTPPVSLDLYRLICRSAPQYYGNSQHDAQEFLLWLLNTLEEEISKSALTAASKKGALSNVNLIRQLFWGQFKSTVKCPNCQHESVTFEPYSCISLPVPHQEVHAALVSIIFRNSSRNRKFGIFLDGLTLVKQLRSTISSLSGLHEECIMLVDFHGNELGRIFHDEQHVLIVNGRHLYAVEVPIGTVRQSTMDHRTGKEVLLVYAVNCCGSLRDGKWFGLPMIFRVHRDLTHYQFQSVLLKAIGKYVRKEIDVFKVWRDMLFQSRLMDSVPSKCVPLTNYHRPFYMPAVQRALQECQQQGVPPHLKLILEWEQPVVASMFGTLLDVVISEDDSVSHVCSRMFQSQVTTLENCLQLYTQRELLSSDDTWTCSNCQQPQNGAGKKISLWNVPDILILHLKRFKQVGMVRTKLQSLVEFPINGLDMNPYLEKRNMSKSCSSLPRDGFTPDTAAAMLSRTPSQLLPNEGSPEKVKKNKKTLGTTLKRKLARSSNSASTLRPTSHNGVVQVDNNIYDLYAVCNHMGSMNSGHYTAFCYNPSNGCWYAYNDNQVDLISENTHLITKAAYMLFYIRRTVRHDNHPHWSCNIAKSLLLSAVANKSPSYLLGGSHSSPPKRKFDSTSSLPAGPLLPPPPPPPTRMGPGKIHSASAMILPSGPMTTSKQFSPQLSTVGEGATLGRYQTRLMSSDDTGFVHQKTTSLVDQTVTSSTATEYHRRSKSFDSPKHLEGRVSPARSEVVRDKVPERTGYCSRTLPVGHRGKGNSANSALHLPLSGTETCV